ncbi:MAG: type VII toxin-antitoxin system HepT family RNase toxin [Methylomicrobium sp.]
MDREIIEQKLESLRRCLKRIAQKCPVDPETLGKTFDSLAEGRVIPEELAIRLKKAVGFRNIAVHNYEAIDWNIVHAIASRHLEDFTEFARAIASRLT